MPDQIVVSVVTQPQAVAVQVSLGVKGDPGQQGLIGPIGPVGAEVVMLTSAAYYALTPEQQLDATKIYALTDEV